LRIHILSEAFGNQNTRAFLFPILRHRRALQQAGVSLRLFFDVEPALTDCDVLAVNNKWLTPMWQTDRPRAVNLIASLADKVARLVYFDRSSTAGSLDPEVVPLVSSYCKTALFRDRRLYTRPLYCGRLFSDYYHHRYGARDVNPAPSTVLNDPALADRLELSWNTALADYSLLGPRLSALYGRVALSPLLSGPWRMTPPASQRPIAVSCRMNMSYIHDTIAFQRRRMSEALQAYRRSDRISKLSYFRELRRSRIVASPFGTSEINYKDFEVFITGGTLLKPDMSHLETWPNLYTAGVTYAAHDWDLEDLQAVIDDLLADPKRQIEIARAGQERYRAHTCGHIARERFVERFLQLLRPAPGAQDQAAA
jgi:hypothetical protein